jgi:hypothetical protein
LAAVKVKTFELQDMDAKHLAAAHREDAVAA